MTKPAVDLRIEVDGLKKLRAALRDVDQSFSKELGQAGKKAADIVAQAARQKVPVRTGRARDSIRSTAGRGGSVAGGGARAPYYPWLDWGGRVGRNDSVSRPRLKSGRYLYPALAERRDDVVGEFADLVNELTARAGLRG